MNSLLAFYPQIKSMHVALAMLSGAVFALRGFGVLAGMRWPQTLPMRWTSIVIDTGLLTAALMLLTILPWATFGNGWLAVKLALLVVYVVLGLFALGRARRPLTRAACYVLALLTYSMVYGIARAHHPLGVFYSWLA